MGQKSFFSKLAYVIFPGDSRGTNMIDRFVTSFKYGGEDAWLARPTDPAECAIIDLARDAAHSLHVATPRIVMYQDTQAHAPHMMMSGIALGSSLAQTHTPEEIKGMIIHQLSHGNHAQSDIMAIPGLATGAFVASERTLSPYFNKKPLSTPGTLRNVATAGRIAASAYAATLAVVPFLRHTVYRADHDAAEMTSPEVMISALDKIHTRQHTIAAENNEQPSFVERVLNTTCRIATPSYEARIKELHDMRRNPDTHTHGGVFER